jgi:HSP20 family protein
MKSLIPWRQRSADLLDTFRQDMRDVFERFFGEPVIAEKGEMLTWAPRVDIAETDKEIQVKADLPGVDAKDVEISVSDGSLVLRGEKKEEREEKKKDYHRVERFEGRFYREIPLPSGTDPDKISATSSKGVVTVSIPKAAQAQAKKITVKTQD